MRWVNFLHIYQPPFQSKKILEQVVNESYRPLFKGLLEIPRFKLNLNINGSLCQLLVDEGYEDVISAIRELAESGRIEFTETAKYHPILPLVSEEEMIKQIKDNHATNKKFFGESYDPSCFFPPEMAYSDKVAKVVDELGYSLILLDQISYNGGESFPEKDRLFKIKDTSLLAAFRERRVSNAIMSGIIRSKSDFLDLVRKEIKKDIYICTAMDGETFGHHRPGLDREFMKIMSLSEPEQIFFSELSRYFEAKEEIDPVEASWATSKRNIERGNEFVSWKDSDNKVHKLQWKLVDFLKKLAKKKKTPAAREKISRALASDQFFWASGEPWWSIEIIEKGAWAVLEAIKSLPDVKEEDIQKAQEYYEDILAAAFLWQRSGRIEKKARKYKEKVKIPFKERTLEKGKPEVYYAFIEKMKDKMKEAAEKENFERAILWRDAVTKLEEKDDIYDAIHAVDLLRMEVSDKELTKLMDKYKEEYEKIRPGQPERRKI